MNMPDGKLFKKVIMGFECEAVLDYISKLTKATEERERELNASVDALVANKDELERTLKKAEEERDSAKLRLEELTALRSSLAEETAKLRGELELSRSEAAESAARLVTTATELDVLRENAAKYAETRESVANILMNATQNAEEIKRKAKQEADGILQFARDKAGESETQAAAKTAEAEEKARIMTDEAKAVLEQANREAAELSERIRREAEAGAEQIRAEAKEEAERIRAEAYLRAETLRAESEEKAGNLRRESEAALSRAIGERDRIKKEIDTRVSDMWAQFTVFAGGLESARSAMLDSIRRIKDHVEVFKVDIEPIAVRSDYFEPAGALAASGAADNAADRDEVRRSDSVQGDIGGKGGETAIAVPFRAGDAEDGGEE